MSEKLKLEPTYTPPPNDEKESHASFNRRRLPKLLIYPHFQLLLIGSNLGVLFLAFAGFWYTSQQIIAGLTPMAKFSNVEAEFFQRFLAYQEIQFRNAYLTAVILAAIVSGGVTLLLSHRVAGPIVRLRGFLRSLIKHEPTPPLTFRDGDFLSDLPGLVNDAVDALRKPRR